MTNESKIQKILKEVAERDGVSVEYVREEIQKAIDIGMSNPDPNIRLFWMKVPHEGVRPTPEEVLNYLSTQIDHQLS